MPTLTIMNMFLAAHRTCFACLNLNFFGSTNPRQPRWQSGLPSMVSYKAGRLLTKAASVLLSQLRGNLREGCSLAGLEGLVRLVETEGEARCWRVDRAIELLQGVGEGQPRDRAGMGGYVEGILALAWMKRAAMCLRVMGCVEVEKNMGAARRAAGGEGQE